jgi:hypothetical protein
MPTHVQRGQVSVDSFGAFLAVTTISDTNITLSAFQTINGYLLTDGDRILVTGQTDPTEDGIYIARTGAWERAEDGDVGQDLGSQYFKIEEGTYAGQHWGITNKVGAGVIGTDQIAAAIQAETSTSTEVFNETPTVTPGTNTVTAANDPIDATLRVYRNGVRQEETEDYSQSGTTITFVKTLRTNDRVILDYQYLNP